jgi:hypothetical protein
MAELAASVISIAHAVCMLIENTQKAIRYIEEVKSINEPIEKLLVQVKDLHGLIAMVESSCEKAETILDSGSKSLRQVRKALVDCKVLLEDLRPIAYDLAALKSVTWQQKYEVKRQLDRLKGKIQTANNSIQWNIGRLNIGLHCINTEIHMEINATRRTSEATSEHQTTALPVEIRTAQEHDISPLSRTFSDADTIFGPDPDLDLRTFPTSSSMSLRPSISSTISHTPSLQYNRSDSVTSATELTPLTSKHDWKDFEFHIMKCVGRQGRIEMLRAILQRHSDGAALARSTDAMERTPLHSAALRGDVELGRILIDEYQADVNAKDAKPNSILDIAVANRKTDFVALLLEHNVNEGTISKKNETSFVKMKRTIKHKNRTVSQSSQRGGIT